MFLVAAILVRCSPPNSSDLNRMFRVDRQDLEFVVGYLMESPHNRVSIRDTDFTGLGMHFNESIYFLALEPERTTREISCLDTSEAVSRLFSRGYRSIVFDREEGVDFLRWSNIREVRGIVYIGDGYRGQSLDFLLPFLIEIEPLDHHGWYFYVENFHEWRRLGRPAGLPGFTGQ